MHYLLRYIGPYTRAVSYSLAGEVLPQAKRMAEDLVDTHQPYVSEVELFYLNEEAYLRLGSLTYENIESCITPLEIYKNREWHPTLDGNIE